MSNEIEDYKHEQHYKDGKPTFGVTSYKIKNFKPFNLEELKNNWFLSLPNGDGTLTNKWGRWVDGKMVEDGRETVADPFAKGNPKPEN